MALRTPPSYLQNGSHPAEQDRLTTQGLFRTSGVLLASDLQVTQSSVAAMSVQIAAGWGNIIGTTQSNMGAYQFYNDAAATATITTADLTNPRIDLICITVRDAYYTGANNDVIINVVAGTPAGSPAVPATPANSLVLAQVAVAALATTIVNANITDLRQVVAPVNVAQSVAGKNAIINGGMDIWQRGTSIALAASAGVTYLADRWCTFSGANQALTISRQATADTTNLPNIQYCARYQRNSGQTGTSVLYFAQSLETVNSIAFAGKQVTVSFYVRAGANFSAANLLAIVYSGTGTDQNVLTSYTGQTAVALTTTSPTTTWQRISITGTVAATATELCLTFNLTPVGTAGANDYYEVTGVQLELGSVATTFSRAGGNSNLEVASSGSVGFDGVLVSGNSSTNPSGSGTNAWASYIVAGKNLIANGAFDVAQRGTSASFTGTVQYYIDQWYSYLDPAVTATISQISVNGITDNAPAGVQYALRSNCTTNVTSSSRTLAISITEGAMAYAGQTLTLSYYLRVGSGVTSAIGSSFSTRAAKTSTAYDMSSTGGFPLSTFNTSTFTRVTQQIYVTSATVTNSANLFELDIGINQVAGVNSYFDITGVQLEVGTVATPFSRKGGTVVGEINECRRYYYRHANTSAATTYPWNSMGVSTTTAYWGVDFPISMRAAPILSDASGVGLTTATSLFTGGTTTLFSTASEPNGCTLVYTHTAATLTASSFYLVLIGTGGYLGFSSEV